MYRQNLHPTLIQAEAVTIRQNMRYHVRQRHSRTYFQQTLIIMRQAARVEQNNHTRTDNTKLDAIFALKLWLLRKRTAKVVGSQKGCVCKKMGNSNEKLKRRGPDVLRIVCMLRQRLT